MNPIVDRDPALAQFAADVAVGLQASPRQLSPTYFYDDLGLALFEAICRLPWYRITRAETALIDRHGAEVFRSIPGTARIVELGSGSGEKLAALIRTRRDSSADLEVHLVDASPAAIDASSLRLEPFAGLTVLAHEASYETGVIEATAMPCDGPTIAICLGSNIGNFDPPARAAFLSGIRRALGPGDALLIGVDLVKPERDLLLAYDDPLGVTAAFNRNLLTRINRELGGDFRVDRFAHRATWRAEQSRVEMHLVSLDRQRVLVPAANLDVSFECGDTIWTESSYKFTPDGIVTELEAGGFAAVRQWIDQDAGVALTLARAV